MQLHSGSGFLMELLVLDVELVELVPDPLLDGGFGCRGHVNWRFLGYCMGMPERWLAAALA